MMLYVVLFQIFTSFSKVLQILLHAQISKRDQVTPLFGSDFFCSHFSIWIVRRQILIKANLEIHPHPYFKNKNKMY